MTFQQRSRFLYVLLGSLLRDGQRRLIGVINMDNSNSYSYPVAYTKNVAALHAPREEPAQVTTENPCLEVRWNFCRNKGHLSSLGKLFERERLCFFATRKNW